MTRVNKDTLQLLWNEKSYPCLSLYLPVIRDGNEVVQSPIRLNSILARLQDYLKKDGLTVPEIDKLFEPAAELVGSPLFWAFAGEGVAIFLSGQTQLILTLDHQPDEYIVLDDHFVLRPLLNTRGADFNFVLLAVGRGGATVYRGDRERLSAESVEGLPASLASIFSTYVYEKQRQQYGGSAGAVNHGFDNRKDRDPIMVEEYCRKIDQKVLEHFKAEQLPLVVASVDDLFARYHKVSKYPYLIAQNVTGSPDHYSLNVLHQKAVDVLFSQLPDEPKARWEQAMDLAGSSRIRDQIAQIIEAAIQGRVETLFLPQSVILPGHYNVAEHRILHHLPSDEDVPFARSDLLDQAAAEVLKTGGQLYEVAAEQLPVHAQALAVLRY